MRAWVLLLFLAGCVAEVEHVPVLPAEVDDAIQAPEWAIGDWWMYRTEFGGAMSTGTRIVTGEEADDWIVDTDNVDTAWFTVLDEISTLGRIKKGDLAGSQGDARVRFFEFPLEHGRSWDVEWDGLAFTATAHVLPGGTALIRYEREGEHREVAYDATARWFTMMRAVVDGEVQWHMQLERSGRGYEGEYVRWDVQAWLSTGAPDMAAFSVPEDATDVWYRIGITCDVGAYALRLWPVGAEALDVALERADLCPAALHETGTLPAVPGPWRADVLAAEGGLDVAARKLATHRL